MELVVPFLSDVSLRETAESFLREYNNENTIPVPIEEIIEFDFKMDIITMPGFHLNYEVDAFISHDLTEIRIDKAVAEAKNKNRYRFSLAHELAHRILHADIFRKFSFSTIGEWKQSRDAISEKQYGRLEFQANMLGGLILVPPNALSDKFQGAQAQIAEAGASVFDATPETWDMIERFLAAEFGVSQAVIGRRAISDGLWHL